MLKYTVYQIPYAKEADVKRIRFGLSLVLILSFVGTVLFAAGTKESPATPVAPQVEAHFAMVVFYKGAEFWEWAYAGMKDAARAISPRIKTELQGPVEWDGAAEARTVEQMIAKQVDGILVTAGDAKALVPAINKAIDKGIPTICFDSNAPESRSLGFIGTNNYNAGFAAGKAMNGWLGGNGEVILATIPGPDHLAQRIEGFKAALKQYGNVKVVQELNDEGDVAKTETVVTAALQANPKTKGIFCLYSHNAPGAAAAVRNVGRTGDVKIMGFDFSAATLELIEKGEVTGTVGQDPYLMGYMGTMLLYSAMVKTDITASNNQEFGHVPPLVDTGVAIIEKDDIDRYKTIPK